MMPSITEALALFPGFGGASWAAWTVALKAAFGLSMAPAEADVFARHTGRQAPPTTAAREAWFIVGRRGGKSRIAAVVAVYLAAFRDYADILAPGERGTMMVIASDRRQARVVFRYISALFDGVPLLAAMVEHRTKDSISLFNGVVIEVHTASFRTVRGYTCIGCVLDEVAYWRSDDSAEPDREIVAAIKPGMLTVPGALLLGISTPYARRGVLHAAYREHFGMGGPVVVWSADTLSMNPGASVAEISSAFEADESAAWSEYGRDGEIRFRSDLEAFVSREAVEACVVPGRIELPPVERAHYCAFVDPSGGSRDSFTLAVGHVGADDRFILDALRERKPPFSPEAVVADFAGVLKSYAVNKVVGDRYGGEFARELFRKHGIEYMLADRPKSDFYRDALALLNSHRIELLDHPRLIAQICSLERRTSRGGKDSIDHPPGGHDDLANVVLGLAATTMGAVRQPALTGDMFFEAPKRPSGFERDLAPEGVRDRNFWMSDE